jgi:membrane protease YdiL (CAAX protease family)
VPGLFAQGGIAEEVVFRGYLFRHFRAGRGFWPAACLSAIPFVAVHLTLFASLDFAVALASLLVALSLSFPFAWLFERAGNSIWPPAILHFAVQGSIKPVDADGAGFLHLAIGWMILSAVAPWILLLMPGRSAGGRP